jgi:hypothetical protein
MLEGLAARTGRNRQAEIDALIRRKVPGVAQTDSPRNSQPETVYSKLRNEYTHRSHVSLAQVRSDMETHHPRLIAIGRDAIKSP